MEPVMSYPDCRLNLGTLRGSKRKMESTQATRDLKYKWKGGPGRVLGLRGYNSFDDLLNIAPVLFVLELSVISGCLKLLIY